MNVRTLRLSPWAILGLLVPSAPLSAFSQAAPGAPPAPGRGAPPASPSADAQASAVATFDLEAALLTPEQGLTAEDAGRRARARAPQIASAEATARSADWDAKAQSSGFLPQLQVSAQYRRISLARSTFSFTGDPGETAAQLDQIQDPAVANFLAGLAAGLGDSDFTQPVDSYALTATARVPVSDMFLRVLPNYKGARGIADARAVQVETQSATIDLQAREAFYNYARAFATQVVAEQALKQAEAQAAQAKLFVDAGTAAPVDLMTATARVESMRSSLARARGAVAVRRNALATLMGAQSGDVAGIRERVTALPEAPSGSLDELLARGLKERAELRAMRKLIDANDQLKSAERNAALPSLSLEGSALYARPNPRYVPPVNRFRSSWEVSATLSWTPNGAVTGYQRAQRASAEVDKARADLGALEDAVRIEVVQAYEDFQAAAAAARASEAQQKAAEETYRVRLATYRVGAGVQIDLLTADLALTQARLDYVNAVLDARTALARLQRATGATGG